MRRVLDLRIVRWERKLAAALGVWVIGTAIIWLLPAAIPSVLLTVVAAVVHVASFLLCARVFRGRGEAIEPPRPWWRMTARARLSARLGFLFAILTLWVATAVLLGAVGIVPGRSYDIEEIAAVGVMVFEFGVLAYLYLNSAARLRRLPSPPPPVQPSFRPPRVLR